MAVEQDEVVTPRRFFLAVTMKTKPQTIGNG